MANEKGILLVQSDAEQSDVFRTALDEHQLGRRVVVAGTAGEALDYLYRRGSFRARPAGLPAVVFLDHQLPTSDALEVLRHIRADRKLKLLPVVMLSNRDCDEDVLQSYGAGANGYVVKPDDFHQLFDTLMGLGFFWGVINHAPPTPTEAPVQPVFSDRKPLQLAATRTGQALGRLQ